jgi:murein endopeptidase
VKETAVPAYYRLPSRDEQRAAEAKSERIRELIEVDEKRALRYRDGELDIGPKGTEVAARYLEHRFFVSSNGSEVRAKRRFVRTIGGTYVKRSQLAPYRARGAFSGVELDGDVKLPIAWTVRAAQPQFAKERDDGTLRIRDDHEAEPIERMVRLETWRGLRRMGGKLVHEIETPTGTRYLRSWFAAVAREIERPAQVPAGSPWVHVDLDQQTAVLYEGGRPAYATLIATGLEGHETPTGVFEIRRKRITDTMADLGPEAGDDRYRIEDVPWTQYFEGSIALHAAFWHQRYGLPRSHGCVNLSPPDAQRIFRATLPRVPEGWHGISTEETELEGSFVVVTDASLGAIDRAGVLQEQAGDEAEQEAAPQATVLDGAEPEAARGPPDPSGIAASATALEPWVRRRPTEVKYALTSERSARWVANLFRVHHVRMEALNEGIDLDRTLKPQTEILVYRHDPEQRSRSIGKANRGRVDNGAPLPDGEGRLLKAPRGKMWATRRTVALLDTVLRAWPRIEPRADPILVGAMSLPKGGKLAPHQTHQSGRDVDLGYPQIREPDEQYNWRDMDARNLDVRRTWRLLHLLRATGELELVFIDRALQKLLYDTAVQKNWLSDPQLAEWLEYPRAPGEGTPIVQHVPGHVDHLHVRFTCGDADQCE